MGPIGALSNSAKTNVKSCTWEAQSLAVLRAGNGLVVGSSAEKVLGGHSGHQAEHEPAVCTCNSKGQLHPELYEQEQSIFRKSRQVFIPLYTALIRPLQEYLVQFWPTPYSKDIDKDE